jgi:para-nitrobenzyl esterase
MEPVAATSLGRLRGAQDGAVQVFRGVPFAQPPVGPLRWRPPQPPQIWEGMREATAFGPIPPQTIGAGQLARSGGRMEEDCLYLNVWTSAADGARRPILVFLHGGGMTSGSGSQPLLDGARLAAREDLVVVTLNYRLGPLGVLHAPGRLGERPGETTANLALQDVMAALAFLRREGAAFGGDPTNITLAGHSSGAVATACLLAAPSAWPLFDKAILQSGGLERVIATQDAAQVADAFFDALGSPSPEEVRALPLDAIMAGQAASFKPRIMPPRGEFHPFIDGVLLPEHPVAAALVGRTAPVPVIAGSAANEWRTFDAAAPDETFDEAHLAERVRAILGKGATPEHVLAVYRAEAPDPEAHPGRALAAQMVGDLHFAAPIELFVRGHAAAGNPAYHYELTWRSPTRGHGACHNICLPLLFGTLDVGSKLCGSDEGAHAMSRRLQDSWAAFARTGDPSTSETGPWPLYAPHSRRTLRIGREVEQASRLREDQLSLWRSAYPWLERGLLEPAI